MQNQSNNPGYLPGTLNFAISPSETARRLFYYPTWCGHCYCTSDYYYRRDYFPPNLVIFIRQGCLHVEYRGNIFDAQKGDVVLLDCSEPHYYHAKDGLEFLYIHFDGLNSHDICHYILDKSGPLIRQDSNLLIGKELYDMVEFYKRDDLEPMIQSSARIHRIFEHLLTQDRLHFQDHTEDPIAAAIRYIRGNIGKDISLQDLAERANLSTFYFAHCFKEETGFAPMEYIINTRLERARELLAQTNMPVGEVAYEVGYSSTSSLNNMFVKREGISPRQYRNRFQTNN